MTIFISKSTFLNCTGTISASDIKLITADRGIDLLNMRLEQFLAHKASIAARGNIKISPHLPVYVTENDTLETILNKLITEKIHRVWVVDKVSPFAVFALTSEDAMTTGSN